RVTVAELASNGQDRLIQRLGSIDVAFEPAYVRLHVDRRSEIALAAEFLRQRQRLLGVSARLRDVPAFERRPHERLQSGRDPTPVADLLRNRQALLETLLRFFMTTHQRAKLSRAKLRAAPQRIASFSAFASERFDRDCVSQGEVAAIHPILLDGIDESEPERGPAFRFVAPGMRRKKVLSFEIEPGEPRALVRS